MTHALPTSFHSGEETTYFQKKNRTGASVSPRASGRAQPERRKTWAGSKGRGRGQASNTPEPVGGPGEEMVARSPQLRGCTEAPPPPHPRPSPSQEGRKPEGERGRGRVKKREAAALECSFRGPADARSEDIAPHSSSCL